MTCITFLVNPCILVDDLYYNAVIPGLIINFCFRLSEIESGALTDKLYCRMGVLKVLVAIQIRPCDN